MLLCGRMGRTGIYLLIICGITAGEDLSTTTEVSDTSDVPVPEKPRNLTALDVSPNALSLGWLPPRKANGAIEGYQIYFMFGNYTDVATYRYQGNPDLLKFKLNNLKPSTQYKIWVKAFTRKNVGDPSDPLITMTDIAGPGAPKILNATCKTQESIAVQWARPEKIEHSLDYYYLKVDAGDALYSNITLPASKEHLETTYVIENVTSNTIYDIAVQAGTKSPRTGKVVTGPFSEPVSINVKINCDKSEEFLKRATSELSAGMVAGVICAGFAFLLALTAFVVWRKCFRTAYYYLDDPPCNVPTVSLDWNAPPPACRGDHKGAIPVNLFSRHVAELHADGDIGFSREYESIQLETASEGHTSEHSQQPENRAKNRYLNIIAYDHSRVHLLSMNGQRRGIDYINANYIDGFQWSRAYIGTQGPLPSTFDCFWRMVWEQRVNIIVMITNLVERGRRKCDMYWPKEGTETYGVIQVKLVKEDIMATYTVRTLQIRHLRPNLQIKKKKPALIEKLVYQYHYTSWPDHGTPDHPLPVLEFIKKSAAANPSDSGPIIVHCSAGVGRTGTYIVIDAMLRQIKYRNEVNIYGFLLHIRSQRNFLVQTEEQYIFIHDAILEAIEAGDTSIPRETFPKYVRMLQGDTSEEKNEKWKSLEAQYKQVLNFVMKEKEANASHKAINKPKNRTLDLVPVDNYRVHLTPKPGEDGSDYINASWIQGFCNLREFIITQHPMKSTINDFWQMVWDHSAQTIVMISIIDNQDFEVFWPVENECVEVDAFRVKLVNEQMFTSYMVLHFVMQSLQDDYELNVKMIQCPNWPHHNAITELYHLPNSVQNLVNIQNGPIIVVDRYGGTEAATFCALTSIKKHMHYDAHIDVYMYAKVYHIRRPGVWMNTNDYLNLHLAVQSLCNPPEDVPDTFNMPNGGANGSVSNECVRMPPEEAPLLSAGYDIAGKITFN